jgi:adenylate cyclase
MLGSDGRANPDVLIERARLRYAYAIAGTNVAGALIVFLFLEFVLPNPSDVHHPATELVLNAVVFVVSGAVGTHFAWAWSARLWRARLGWVAAGREPSEREREWTLRFPLTQQKLTALMWAIAGVGFTALNAPFSLEAASNTAITIGLGALVTCALGYLVGERLLRPFTALALASGIPPRPQLPGVAARALLSWTLGTGAVLLGLALIAVGGLHERRFTAERLSIAVLVLSAIGIAVGLATMLALARSLADPIEELRRAVARVEQGEFDEPVPVDDGSEVGLLQAGFNRMLAGLRERERLRDLFGRQVGEDVVRHALEHGVELGGEAREAAVLFIDLQGSTALAESRDPGEVVRLLNAFFAVVVDVVASHGGWVNKFEGDAALCVFGAPLPDPDAASAALATARELRERLRSELGEVKAGIGVSAGRVVAGNVGAARRFEYTVIGDPVNEAARLTELAKTRPERALASAAALSCASDEEAARWRAGDEAQLRGRSEPTRIATPCVARGGARPPAEETRPASRPPAPERA